MAILSKNDIVQIKEIDGTVKNKFSFAWLERTIDIGNGIKIQIGEDFKKIDVAGQAFCQLCNKQINYGSRGAVVLDDHTKSSKHTALLKERQTTHPIDQLLKQYKDDYNMETSDQPNQEDASVSAKPARTLVPMCDRISNAEASILGVMAENSMPMTYAPVLVNLAKSLARDPKALAELHMDRTTASYKMTHGLAEGFQQKLISSLQKFPFSMNIDESTSNNHKKVLTVLVSYYNTNEEKVMVEHWCSTEVTKANSESLFCEIVKLVEDNQIPWTNLVSVLMDSCAVMRGKKSGVEKRLRDEKAPHLLDIDGDSCHHLHNSSKRLCAPFSYYLEGLFLDLHNDFKYSPDLQKHMSEVCEILGVTYSIPERFVSHRWLSAYDISLSTNILMDAYVVFYYGFLKADDKRNYYDAVKEIYKKKEISSESKERLKEIQAELTNKALTEDGKKTKAKDI